MPLTKREIDAMTAGTILWDSGRGSVTGFGVRCQKRAKSFALKYSLNGRSGWHTIGRYGSPWTVEAARSEAKRLLGMVASGVDPRKKIVSVSDHPSTVSELCDRYMEAATSGLVLTRFNRPKKQSTLSIDVGRIERHIKPLIGNVAVAELDGRLVRRMVADIAAGKTAVDVRTAARGRARVTGGHGTAARVADLLSGIMAWAIEQDLIVHNPVHGVRRYRGEARQRYLSSTELAALGAALNPSPENRSFHPYVSNIVALLCLTGCRLSEIAGLQWSEIDFQDRCLRLQDTKTGRSLRPIGRPALELLAAMPRVADSSYVFPATKSRGPFQGAKRAIKNLFIGCGLSDVSSHTLRHTFGSVASSLGYSDSTIGGLLGHAGRGVTSRYIHRPDEALASAADKTSCHVASHLWGARKVCLTLTDQSLAAKVAFGTEPSPQVGSI